MNYIPAGAPLCACADPAYLSGRRSRPELPYRALAKQHLWQPGTNLQAWLFTILHHQHVNDVRRSIREGPHVMLGEAAELTVQSKAILKLAARS
jgi:hypothetical protein